MAKWTKETREMVDAIGVRGSHTVYTTETYPAWEIERWQSCYAVFFLTKNGGRVLITTKLELADAKLEVASGSKD